MSAFSSMSRIVVSYCVLNALRPLAKGCSINPEPVKEFSYVVNLPPENRLTNS